MLTQEQKERVEYLVNVKQKGPVAIADDLGMSYVTFRDRMKNSRLEVRSVLFGPGTKAGLPPENTPCGQS